MNPIIGITTSFQNGHYRLDHAYVNAVRVAHGQPLLLPLVSSVDEASELCNQIHGLIIPGGPGITVNMVGVLPPQLEAVDPRRWKSDNLILDVAIEQNLPILGICYGMQLLCIRAGGSIYADVERQVAGTLAHSEKRGASFHPLEILHDCHLAKILDTDVSEVNSRHFQAIRDHGDGYAVSARSSDGVIEAIERFDGIHIGVQFHPERMQLQPLFRNLVHQAQIFRDAPPRDPVT